MSFLAFEFVIYCRDKFRTQIGNITVWLRLAISLIKFSPKFNVELVPREIWNVTLDISVIKLYLNDSVNGNFYIYSEKLMEKRQKVTKKKIVRKKDYETVKSYSYFSSN